jgi:hypothetical protein
MSGNRYESLKVDNRVIGDPNSKFAVHGVIREVQEVAAYPSGTVRNYTVEENESGRKFLYAGESNLRVTGQTLG